MKTGLLFLFLLFTSFSRGQGIDVLHYKYNIDIKDEDDTLKGLAIITFRLNESAMPVAFDLEAINSYGRGMAVISAGIARPDGTLLPTPVLFKKDKVLFQMPHLKKGDTQSVFISYQGIPDDGLIVSKNKFGERTFFADNWPNRAHHWIPCVDHPADKASVEFLVTAPAKYNVISNGLKAEEKAVANGRKYTHWREDTPLSTKVMVIGAARFAVKTYADSPENLPISAWVYPKDSTEGFHDYALAPGIVRFFSDYIAPFPFRKLANVQSTTIFGGMENASCIFYAENSVTGNRSSEALMAHEIAHQWFGDMASEKSFAHLWLSEGFATYLTHLYFEQKYGKQALQERLQEDREEVIQFAKTSSRPVVDSTENLMSLLNANSYQKGGWVLHMLRREVGDSIFQKIIQTYYNQYKGRNAETRDFQAVAEAISGKELKWFFDQWLYRPGIPQLSVIYSIKETTVHITIEQEQQNFFRLPLDLIVTDENGQKTKTAIRIEKPSSTFHLTFGDKIKQVEFDPDTNLLYEHKSQLTRELEKFRRKK